MKHLSETLKERTLHVLAAHAQQYIDDQWKPVWDRHIEETERIFAKGGDSAYGFYCLKLFQPLAAEIVEAGLVTRPVLPGIFPQSEEHWGPWENRERRFWSVIQQENGKAIGTLITRFFHDHTRLRLPRQPHVYAIHETDPAEISRILIQADPCVLDSRTVGEA